MTHNENIKTCDRRCGFEVLRYK